MQALDSEVAFGDRRILWIRRLPCDFSNQCLHWFENLRGAGYASADYVSSDEGDKPKWFVGRVATFSTNDSLVEKPVVGRKLDLL